MREQGAERLQEDGHAVGAGAVEAHIADSNQRDSIPPATLRGKTLLGHAKVIAHLREPALGNREQKIKNRSEVSQPSTFADLHRLPSYARSFISLNARELTQRVCERVRSHAVAKEVEIVLNCACDSVWVHPQAFAEALYELLKNAVQATKRLHPVTVDVNNTGKGEVLWQIRDGGEGMSEQVLAELGQPPRSAWQGGPGLGVAYAWAVVEQHGGLLRFESAPGIGTTASIWLPELC